MSVTQQSPGRIIGLVLISVITGLFVLINIFGAIHVISDQFAWNWNGHADLVTGRYPFIDSWAELPKNGEAGYSGVNISSDAALPVPRALQAVDLAMTSLIGILGGLLVTLIAVRLLAGKSVSRLARWGLLALGVLIMVKSTVGPQLQVLAVNIAVQELGYPILDPGVGGGLTEQQFPEGIPLGMLGVWAITPADSVLFVTGAIIAVMGFLLAGRLTRPIATQPDIR